MAKSVVFIPGVGGSDLYVPNPNTNLQTFGGSSPAAGYQVYLTWNFAIGSDASMYDDALRAPSYTLTPSQMLQDSDLDLTPWGPGIAPGYTKTTAFFASQQDSSGNQIWSIRTRAGGWLRDASEPSTVAPHNCVYFEYPYDWRQDIKQHAYELNYFIANFVAPANTGADIYLVSHSTGGLISRAYLSDKYLTDPSGGNDPWTKGATMSPHPSAIKGQILIAVPSHGAPKAYRVLKTGTGFNYNSGPFVSDFPPNQQALAANLPLVYQLLPDNQYGVYFDSTKNGDYWAMATVNLSRSETTVQGTYLQANSKLSDGTTDLGSVYALDGNNAPTGSVSTLVANALSLHSDLGYDSFLTGNTYAFYSDAMSTFAGLLYKDPTKPQNFKPLFGDIGDGTVPAKSVYDLSDFSGHSGYDSNNVANDQPSPTVFYYADNKKSNTDFDPTSDNLVCMGSKWGHTELPARTEVLNMVLGIVNGTTVAL